MNGLSLTAYRAIETRAAEKNPARFEEERSRHLYIDPYAIRTQERYVPGRRNPEYRFLFQTGLFPDISYTIGKPSENSLIARIKIVLQRCFRNIALMVMSLVRSSEYGLLRKTYKTIDQGSLIHFRTIQDRFGLGKKLVFAKVDISWDTWLAYTNKITKLAYRLANRPLHKSLQGKGAKPRECNSMGLYLTINCMKSQYNSVDWTRGTPIREENAYSFFDRMEPRVCDLLEKTQNFYNAFMSRPTLKPVASDAALQACISAFIDSYENAFTELC